VGASPSALEAENLIPTQSFCVQGSQDGNCVGEVRSSETERGLAVTLNRKSAPYVAVSSKDGSIYYAVTEQRFGVDAGQTVSNIGAKLDITRILGYRNKEQLQKIGIYTVTYGVTKTSVNLLVKCVLLDDTNITTQSTLS
jgi:hypothetical protein